ncbi:MAG: hypothetical protein KY433_12345 [Actinobacteria bacterium]|nr:hypothetical protein [Actinomycetota bacterium]
MNFAPNFSKRSMAWERRTSTIAVTSAAARVATAAVGPILYVTGEESAAQVRGRAERIDAVVEAAKQLYRPVTIRQTRRAERLSPQDFVAVFERLRR